MDGLHLPTKILEKYISWRDYEEGKEVRIFMFSRDKLDDGGLEIDYKDSRNPKEMKTAILSKEEVSELCERVEKSGLF